jgi:maltooligosyltrehalose trehalohydrolase
MTALGLERGSIGSNQNEELRRAMNFGPRLIGPARTRFHFWAPARERVALEIDGLEPIPMRRLDDGWFEADAPCGAGAAYRYRIADDLAVVDPAARALRGGVFGRAVVTDPDSYRWSNVAWSGRPWTDCVFYELHVGAFGGFAGVKAALPRLADLGVTAVELMPISAFPGDRNWGYDGVLPWAPHPSYGDPDELKALIDAAHGLGTMVFLDVVYNHFGPEGSFISHYAPQFFQEEAPTPWGPAIDFGRPQVRRFFAENAIWWLEEFRFDGLRFDAAHAITHPDWLDETAAEIRARLEPGRCVHLVLENDHNIASHMRGGLFDAQWNDDAHHVLHVLLTRETSGYYAGYADRTAERLARCLREGFVYQGEPSPAHRCEPRGTPSADLPPSAFVMFLQNHDQIGNRAFGERLTTLADPRALEAAIALQLLCPQIPLIFMGEEEASESPFLYFAEHGEDLAEAIREGRKKEFETIASAADDLPDPNEASTFERSIAKPNPALASDRAALYRRLLKLRRKHISPALERARALDARAVGPAAVVARWELGDGRILTLAVNLGDEPAMCVSHPTTLHGEGDLVFESAEGAGSSFRSGALMRKSTVAVLQARNQGLGPR